MPEGLTITVKDKRGLDLAIQSLAMMDFSEENPKIICIQNYRPARRTSLQNNALHKWCEMLSEAFAERGLDMKKVLKPHVEIPWTKHMVKEHLWREVQKAVLGVESTTEPKPGEYSKVYDVLNRHLIDRFNIHVPWPERDR